MRQVVRLVTKSELLTQEQAKNLEEQLFLFPPEQLPEYAKRVILNALYQLKEPDKKIGWGFTMISNKQAEVIINAIVDLPPSKRPIQTLKTFNFISLYLRHDTGEIMLTREQIAEKIKAHPNDVSSIMKTLEGMGVIRREYQKVEGMRGRGVVIYYVNPDVAWNGSLEVRKQERDRTQKQFTLKLIEGGMTAV